MTSAMTSTTQGQADQPGSSSSSSQPEIFRLTPLNDLEGEPVKVQTSSARLSAREQRMLDELAKLFSIQEERCLSDLSRGRGRERESTRLSKASLASSSSNLDASFIYQHVDFQVLSRCVPGFVKSNLNKNCRYLPETFILRVNYWRRRRMIGDDTNLKRGKKKKVARVCAELGNTTTAAGTATAGTAAGTAASSSSSGPRTLSGRSLRPQTGRKAER